MIRLTDAFVLAYTKLRVHRIRTGIAVAISGLLFGLIAAVIIVSQGIFSSVDGFSDVGLNNRTILNISHFEAPSFNEYANRTDPAFVSEVEDAYKAMIAKKTAAAKKYGIQYTAATEDPSPITTDSQSKAKVIKESALGDVVVQEVVATKIKASRTPFAIEDFLKDYPSAHLIQSYDTLQPTKGTLEYMKANKEGFNKSADDQQSSPNEVPPSLIVLDGTVSKPFLATTNFDPSKGEIPVIVPFKAAEKALGLKTLTAGATAEEKLERLSQVRERISEVRAQFCYRNEASKALLSRALAQQVEMKREADNKDYVKPTRIYTVPDETSCGPVTVSSDTRTAEQKRLDANRVQYEKEVGTYIGEPEQYLLPVRGVGISSEPEMSGQWSASDLTNTLFTSWLGMGTWTIPADMLSKVPESARPAAIFSTDSEAAELKKLNYESYLVEFSDKNEARALLKKSGGLFSPAQESNTFASTFGSSTLVVDELREIFTRILLWTLLIVGGVAIVILAGIIGRTVSEGRRESAIFRAIGANRLDISGVYGMYVVLLSLRVVVFAAVLAVAIALAVEIIFWKDATLGARLAYASADVTKEFHLFDLSSPYLLLIAGTILAAGCIASIIPILLGARRNPIKDMRNDS